ncbi:MAG: DUF1553 domain-containing protein [Acidobacteria bacterium]|nr:DUF1553 domain-containing protein [Acidobacteriota bacterium]
MKIQHFVLLLTGSLYAQISGENCTFTANPDEFLLREERTIADVHLRAMKYASKAATKSASAADLPWRNFIDEEILGRLGRDKIPAAALTTDAEFVRRIYLDLAGRLPKPAEYREFVGDTDPTKREALVDRLLNSPDYLNRWSTWLGDLVQNNRTAFNANQNVNGRNTMYDYLRQAVVEDKSMRDLAWELIAAAGNNYDSGPANWSVRTVTPGGPVQDRYDTAFIRPATIFLGLGHYDCLACHNGRGHLDILSVWGRGVTRMEAYKMSAFFARLNIGGRIAPAGDKYQGSFDITDRATGTYDLNTGFGNRPNRIRIGGTLNVTPEYRDGKTPSAGQPWREAFADSLTADPMFAKNMVNRIWKQLFQLGLAEPVDSLDPARLDPDKPPDAPWTFQTQHPVLMRRLAEHFVASNYSLRETVRAIVLSTTYQLSSRYDDKWSIDYVPLFARHYARRLEAEEVHDVLSQGSGNWANYMPQGFAATVQSAWLLPDTTEPGGGAGALMNTFLRGNRDTVVRRGDGSILQSLTMMNDAFIRDRIRNSSSPNIRAVVAMTDNNAAVDELFLWYLGRVPTEAERAKAVSALSRATTPALRTATVEDLAWVLVNKTDFLIKE